MVTTLKAHKLTLNDAHQLLGFFPNYDGSFESHLNLEEVPEDDFTTLHQICDRILHYLTLGQISEGQARELSVALLLQLACPLTAPSSSRHSDLDSGGKFLGRNGQFWGFFCVADSLP